MTGAAASVGASESAKRSGNGAGQGTSAAVKARAAFPLPGAAAATALPGAAAGCLPKRSVRPVAAAALVGAAMLTVQQTAIASANKRMFISLTGRLPAFAKATAGPP